MQTKRCSAWLTCAMLTVATTPAMARTIDGWDIAPSGDTCSMASTFADDVTIALIWHPASHELGFMAAGPSWDDLRQLPQKRGRLELAFTGPVQLKSWLDEGARIVGSGDEKTAVIGNWGADHAGELGSAVAAASRVTVTVGNRQLGSYDLSGTPAAYRELMHCGSRLAPSAGPAPEG